MIIFIPLTSGSKLCIKISYQTSKTASAAQWLTPEQTAGKNHPYFFTQCQVSQHMYISVWGTSAVFEKSSLKQSKSFR